ncbi:MAG: DUF3072 domain-containing protein [Pseudomonadota bacterium]
MEQEKRGPGSRESQYMSREGGGLEPMTGAQAADLKTLADEVCEPSAYELGLSRSEASRRIDVLREKIRIGDLPPHTD